MACNLQTIRFIYLVLLTKIAGSIDITDLTVTCDIRNASLMNLTDLPDLCTAGATSSNFNETVDMLTASKSSKPFIYVYSKLQYNDWYYKMNSSQYVYSILQDVNDKQLDGIAFDNLYYDGSSTDQISSDQISELFQILRGQMSVTVFGLTLPKEAELLPNAFNYSYLDSYIDFYIIKTIDYKECKWQTLENTTTYSDMNNSLNALQSVYRNMSKVLLTVQLYSWGVYMNENPVILSYSEMCDKELNTTRTYCKDSLESLLKKGNLCQLYGMAGVYIKYIDFDDVYNTCDCVTGPSGTENNLTFVGASAISFGSLQGIEDDLRICDNFGET